MSEQEKAGNQRNFERFPLDFSVRVSGVSPSNETFSDHGEMHNVSGSGVCFSTRHPEWYTIGQSLLVHVCLPGTDQLDAGMESSATVAWVFSGQGAEHGGGQAQVGIAMDGCMSFETSSAGHDEGATS
ncbi:MAG: PilZ domain-containing protein [Mariprofundus sp.]